MIRRTQKRQKNEVHIDDEGSWAISYGDMITLLLSFFVLYFSTDPKTHKDRLLNRSLLTAFSPLEEGPQKLFEESRISFGKENAESVDLTVLSQWGARLEAVGQKVIVEFPETSFFDSGKVDVSEKGKNVLEHFAEIYMPFAGSYRLAIQAYTDSKPVKNFRGRRFKDNLELSALRSVAAVRVLQKIGVPIDRMRISGYGEFIQLKMQSKTPLALARKVILVIEPAQGGQS